MEERAHEACVERVYFGRGVTRLTVALCWCSVTCSWWLACHIFVVISLYFIVFTFAKPLCCAVALCFFVKGEMKTSLLRSLIFCFMRDMSLLIWSFFMYCTDWCYRSKENGLSHCASFVSCFLSVSVSHSRRIRWLVDSL